MEQIDTNQDGVISPEELMKQIDTNQDGVISPEEWNQVMKETPELVKVVRSPRTTAHRLSPIRWFTAIPADDATADGSLPIPADDATAGGSLPIPAGVDTIHIAHLIRDLGPSR